MSLVRVAILSCSLFLCCCEGRRVGRQKRNGIDSEKWAAQLWSTMPIPYAMDGNVSDPMRQAIVKSLAKISSQTSNCITFRNVENSFLDDSEPFMKFIQSRSTHCRAEATVGKRERINYVQLEDACILKLNLQHLVIHEVLHCLGVDHEHSRLDRDNYVVVNWQNIQEGKAVDFYIQNDEKFSTYDLPYDYSSIMHYGPSFFSTAGGLLKTIEPVADANYLTNYAAMLKAQIRPEMSDKDVQLVRMMYKCGKE